MGRAFRPFSETGEQQGAGVQRASPGVPATDAEQELQVSQSCCQTQSWIVNLGNTILRIEMGAHCVFVVALALLFFNFLFNVYCFLCLFANLQNLANCRGSPRPWDEFCSGLQWAST